MNTNIKKLEEGKTISISELPEFPYKQALISMVTDPTTAKVCVVAVAGNNGNWEAYIGHPCYQDVAQERVDNQMLHWLSKIANDADGTKKYGEKLPQEIAEILFPEWK